jgi:phytoene synthase
MRGRYKDRDSPRLAGERTGKLPFDALGQVLAECAIPHRLVLDHLAGFELDAEGWRPADEADLIRYCYHVAGAVGCMMAIVMGVSPDDEETLQRASDLGIAFQLSNIARDVRDDHEAGAMLSSGRVARCPSPRSARSDAYRPAGPAGRAGGARLRPRRALRSLGPARDFAAAFSDRAGRSMPRPGIYGRIGRRVAAAGPNAWDRRVVVSRAEKAAIMLASLGRAV